MPTDAARQIALDLSPDSPFAVGDRVRVVRSADADCRPHFLRDRQGRVGTVVKVRRIPGLHERVYYKPIGVHLDDDWREFYYDVEDLEAAS